MSMIQFRKCAVLDVEKTRELGKQIYEEGIEAIITVDQKSNLIYHLPKKGAKEDFAAYIKRCPQEIQNYWKKELERYLQGRDFCDGIPLTSLTWLSLGQIETLRSAGISSVENLAKISDGVLEPFGLDGVGLRKRAQAWLDDKSGRAVARIEEQSSKIAQMEEERDEMRKLIDSLKREVEGLKSSQKEKEAMKLIEKAKK